jgi:membrane protein DedA with SNARE-associated domain
VSAAGTVAAGWTDGSSLGYPVVFGGVLLGSIVPVVPTGAVVGAAAALAVSTGRLDLALVLLLSVLGAWAGDVVTFAVCRFGGPAAIRRVARGQHADRIEEVREQFRRHGWLIVVAGRLLPAGRIPVLLAAGALAYPWRRLLPASLLAATLWAAAYALIGVASGGVFDNPLLATLVATVLVLLVGLALNAVQARRGNPGGRGAGDGPDPGHSPGDDPDDDPDDGPDDDPRDGPRAGVADGAPACRPAS